MMIQKLEKTVAWGVCGSSQGQSYQLSLMTISQKQCGEWEESREPGQGWWSPGQEVGGRRLWQGPYGGGSLSGAKEKWKTFSGSGWTPMALPSSHRTARIQCGTWGALWGALKPQCHMESLESPCHLLRERFLLSSPLPLSLRPLGVLTLPVSACFEFSLLHVFVDVHTWPQFLAFLSGIPGPFPHFHLHLWSVWCHWTPCFGQNRSLSL